MRVKYVIQIFRHRKASTIRTCKQLNRLKSDSANFVENLNNVFYCLSNKTLNDANKYSSALSIRNETVERTLQESVSWINSWCIHTKTGKEKQGMYYFAGLIQTITGILQLWTDLKEEEFTFVTTNRFNQDPKEFFFSAIRRHGGNSTRPMTKSFRIPFQRNVRSNLILT